MVRWTAVALLVLAAGLTGWLATSYTTARGLRLSVWTNPAWRGEPEDVRLVRHLDYSPGSRRNPVALPDRSSASLDGWLVAPRGGPYEFEVESDDPVWLEVDGKAVIQGRFGGPTMSGTLRLAKGPVSFRLRVRHDSGASRLEVRWRPPAGYMALVPLPPVMVHPDKPDPGPAVPLPLRVGPFLLLGLALLVGVAGPLSRGLRRLRTDRVLRGRVAVGAALVALTLGVRFIDLSGAGETSDEWAYSIAGRIYVSNVAHGYFQSSYWHTNEEHPPIGKLVYGLVAHVFGTDEYGPLRAAAALMAALTVLVTYLFALRFMGVWPGILAGIVLALLPTFVAHGKVAALDAPSALLFTLAIYLFVRALFTAEGQNRWYLLAGLVASLAFATKFSNVLLLVFLMGLHFASQWRNISRRGRIEMPIAVYLLPVLPGLVLLAVWPWLWVEPFGQLVVTLKHWSYPIEEWFLGRYRQPPWFYFPVCFVATTPALLLVPFGAFVVQAFRRRSFTDAVLLLWFATPFLWTLSVLKQDGVRYIYTMLPAFALMVGSGTLWLLRRDWMRPVAAGAIALYLGWQSWTVHPFYLDYFSEVVGGPATVYKRSWFDVGWWGEGLSQAYEHVNRTAAQGATYDCVGVVNHTVDALRPDLRYSPVRPDYLIKGYLTPQGEVMDGYVEEARVEAAGAPLVIVFKRR